MINETPRCLDSHPFSSDKDKGPLPEVSFCDGLYKTALIVRMCCYSYMTGLTKVSELRGTNIDILGGLATLLSFPYFEIGRLKLTGEAPRIEERMGGAVLN